MKKLLVVCLAAVIVLSAAAAVLLNNSFLSADMEKEILIPKGASTSQIADILKSNGIIKNELVFRTKSKLAGNDNQYKHGITTLNSNMSYEEIMFQLINGMSSGVSVTIPEGYNLKQIAQVLKEQNLIDEGRFFDEIANGKFQYDFITDELPEGEGRLEGYLYPDTYMLEPDMTEHQIIDFMLKEFSEKYLPEYKEQAEAFGMTTHQIITLASIIEKEGSQDLDLISSVFHNRLDSDYDYLESCATVLYAMGVVKDQLTIEDTKYPSAYNTYINRGLPPGPICSPGEEAIKAALYPADTDYMYFIAQEDGTNSFSQTFDEHLEKKGE